MQDFEIQNYLSDLLVRLNNDELRPGLSLPSGVSYQSDLTIAHEAHKEARALKDVRLLAPLIAMLEKEKKTIHRIKLIFVIFKLAKNTQQHYIVDYLFKLVLKEPIKWTRDIIWSGLFDSPLLLQNEIELAFESTKAGEKQKRIGALILLSRLDATYSQRIESICLEFIKEFKKEHGYLGTIATILSKHGSHESIASLKDIIDTCNNSGTINSALNALANISKENDLDFYLSLYQSVPNKEVKSILIDILCKYGNATCIDLMIVRVKAILSKKRKINTFHTVNYQSELVSILVFLNKFNDPRILKLNEFIKTKKLPFLSATELAWFNEHILQQNALKTDD